jgi:hypothetical protein
MKSSDLAEKRTEYLIVGRRLVSAIYRRNMMERCELCVENVNPPNKANLLEYSVLLKKVGELGQEMSRYEQQTDGKIGVLALLGAEPPQPIRLALSLLLARSLCDSVSDRVNTVGELAEFSVGTQSPDVLLSVRQAFSRGGCLRPHCELLMRATLDQCRVSLAERAFAVMLALPKLEAMEFEILNAGRL